MEKDNIFIILWMSLRKEEWTINENKNDTKSVDQTKTKKGVNSNIWYIM